MFASVFHSRSLRLALLLALLAFATPAILAQARPASITVPPNGTTLLSPSTTFKWLAAIGADSYRVTVSASVGGNELYDATLGNVLTTSVTGLPSNALPLYVRLYSHISGSWLSKDFQFIAPYPLTSSSSGQPATQALMAKLTDNNADAFITVFADSTAYSYGSNLAVPQYSRWVSRLIASLGPRFPAYTIKFREAFFTGSTPDLNQPAVWSAWFTTQTGTGPHTLWVSNASLPGTCTLFYQGANAQVLFPDTAPDLFMISLGHNQMLSADDFLADLESLTETIAHRYPTSQIMLVGQNPDTDDQGFAQMQQVNARMQYLQNTRSYGYVDVFSAFVNYPDWQHQLMATSTHPSDSPEPSGEQVWADTVAQAFVLGGTAAIRKPSELDESAAQLVANGNFSAWSDLSGLPDGWTGSGVTVAKDFAHSDNPTGYSLQLTTNGAPGYVAQPISLAATKGHWVTVTCRVYVAAGQSSEAGKCGIQNDPFATVSDVRSNFFTTTYQYGTGAFRWTTVSKYIDPSSGFARVYLWAATDNSHSTVSFDRVSVTVGTEVRDTQLPHLVPPSYLIVGSPKGGEVWKGGTLQNLQWNYSGITGNVDLKLLKNGVGYWTIATVPVGSGGSGSYSWTLPGSLMPGSDYKLRVMSSTNTSLYAASYYTFSIAPGIALVSPNGGQSFSPSSTHTISWSSAGITGNILVALLKGGAGVANIATVPVTTTSYSWKLPAIYTPGTDYQIRVSSSSDPTIYDASDANFTLTPGFTVSSPNGGQVWTTGSTHTIQWNAIGITGTVDLKLLKDGIGYATIANGVATGTTGSYSWTLPASLPAGSTYKVRVMSSTNTAYYAASDTNFSVAIP